MAPCPAGVADQVSLGEALALPRMRMGRLYPDWPAYYHAWKQQQLRSSRGGEAISWAAGAFGEGADVGGRRGGRDGRMQLSSLQLWVAQRLQREQEQRQQEQQQRRQQQQQRQAAVEDASAAGLGAGGWADEEEGEGEGWDGGSEGEEGGGGGEGGGARLGSQQQRWEQGRREQPASKWRMLREREVAMLGPELWRCIDRIEAAVGEMYPAG
jgi:hypothetical protein